MLKKLLTVLFAFFCTGAAACEQQEFFPKATHESAVETITSVFPKLQRVSCIKLFTEMRRCSYEQGDIHFSIGGLKFEVQHSSSEFHYRTLPLVF